jgi:clan AA aspartic protease (TIGR02281 family)
MFVVDTGASQVTLTRALAGRQGLDLKAASKAVLRTANGQTTGLFTSLPSIALDGIEALQVPAVVVDDLGPGLDGLLGLSFLTRFDMRQSAGLMELTVRDAPPAPAASR